MENLLRDQLEKAIKELETTEKGTEEYKSVQRNFEILYRAYIEDYKLRMQEDELVDRLTRKDREEEERKETAKLEKKFRWLPKPDTIWNSTIVIFLTLLVIKYDKEGRILPQKLLTYVNKFIRFS